MGCVCRFLLGFVCRNGLGNFLLPSVFRTGIRAAQLGVGVSDRLLIHSVEFVIGSEHARNIYVVAVLGLRCLLGYRVCTVLDLGDDVLHVLIRPLLSAACAVRGAIASSRLRRRASILRSLHRTCHRLAGRRGRHRLGRANSALGSRSDCRECCIARLSQRCGRFCGACKGCIRGILFRCGLAGNRRGRGGLGRLALADRRSVAVERIAQLQRIASRLVHFLHGQAPCRGQFLRSDRCHVGSLLALQHERGHVCGRFCRRRLTQFSRLGV